MDPTHRERMKANPTAWIAVGLSLLGMALGAFNRIRTEDLAEIQGQLTRQRAEIQHQLDEREKEVGELRHDVRELRRILLEGGGEE